MTPFQVAAVARFIADHLEQHKTFPSVKQIAAETKVSISKTRRVLTHMEDVGLIRRTIRGFTVAKVQVQA